MNKTKIGIFLSLLTSTSFSSSLLFDFCSLQEEQKPNTSINERNIPIFVLFRIVLVLV